VALAGFGLDSLIEIGSSTVVLWELSGSGRSGRACLKGLERGEVYVRRKVMTKVPCSSDVR